MKKRMGKAAALLMAVTMVCGMLAGCGSNGSEKAPETAKAQTEAGAAESGEAREGGGTIVYGSNDYTRINPAMDEHGEINVLIFDGLTDHDGNNEVVPRLAKSWDYDEENSTYTFHLEEGVKWHDGEPFTAEDVKFTIEAIMDPANESENAPNYEDVESITVIDDHTIEFKLSAPNVAFLDYMTMPILPKHLLEGENMQESDFFRAPVGTGPFKLAKWDEGQQIVLEKNEDYFAGPAKIDSIIFKIVSDDNAKALQLKSGELNLAQVTPKDAVTFEGDDAYNVYTMSTSDYRGILYNFRNEYWQENADLIPAINYCIDRQAIIDAVLLGHGQIAYGPLQKNKYNCEDVEKYDFNLDKAAEAFTADNKTDFSVQIQKAKDAGAELVFLPIYYQEASLILAQANKAGFTPKWFGCDGMDGILDLDGFDASLAEDLMFLTPFTANATDEATQKFVADYKEAFGDTPIQFAADAYDCVYVIKAAAEKEDVTPDKSVSDICDALKKGMTEITYDGLTGKSITWSEDGEPTKEPTVVVVKSGEYQVLQAEDAAE